MPIIDEQGEDVILFPKNMAGHRRCMHVSYELFVLYCIVSVCKCFNFLRPRKIYAGR